MASSVVFTFDTMIASLRQAVKAFPDQRSRNHIVYDIMDAACGAFSVFFTQSPSFLSHQQQLAQKHGFSNAQSLFAIQKIPSDPHIRNLLDAADPALLSPVFSDCFSALEQSGVLDREYRVKQGKHIHG